MRQLFCLLCVLLWSSLAMAGDENQYTLSAKQLYSEYDRNEIAADAKYKEKKVIVTGTIQDIGTDILGDPYITLLGGSGFLESVEFIFPESKKASLIHLSKGHKVTVKGIVKGKLGVVQIGDAELVN